MTIRMQLMQLEAFYERELAMNVNRSKSDKIFPSCENSCEILYMLKTPG